MTDAGPILLLTRPEAASRRFLADLRLGAALRVIVSPLIDIAALPVSWTGHPPAALVLTSEHGAAAAGRMGFATGTPAYCVGDSTASMARVSGFAAQSAAGDAAALIELILHYGGPAPLLHLRGEHARGDIAPRLTARGLPCAELVVYRQDDLPLSEAAMGVLQRSMPVVLPLFSPRTVSIMARQGPFAAPMHVVAISDTVAAAALALHPASVHTAARSDAAAMIAATIACLTSCNPAGPA